MKVGRVFRRGNLFLTSAFYGLIAIVISFVVGALFYYVLKEDTRQNKRKQIEEVGSQIINFIMYIWIGKIILKNPPFIKDPMAVLPYPSDSKAFYFATICIFIHIYLKFRNKQEEKFQLLQTFLPIFIVSQFTYEFMQIVFFEMKPNWLLLIFYACLIFLYMILNNKLSERKIQLTILTFLLMGNSLLAIFTRTYVFGYPLHAIYFVLMFIWMLAFIIINNKRLVQQ